MESHTFLGTGNYNSGYFLFDRHQCCLIFTFSFSFLPLFLSSFPLFKIFLSSFLSWSLWWLMACSMPEILIIEQPGKLRVDGRTRSPQHLLEWVVKGRKECDNGVVANAVIGVVLAVPEAQSRNRRARGKRSCLEWRSSFELMSELNFDRTGDAAKG